MALAAAEADVMFAGLAGRPVVALAVSGGADSLALLDLVRHWALRRASPPELVVLTVDHGLRPESAVEARMVAAIAAGHGLRHETLAWDEPKPATGIEAAARAARYRLLAAAARRSGADVVVTAHHRDDQAETLLMRLGRGSGIAGLGGMPEARLLDRGILLFRPFLDVPKTRLVATARVAGFLPVEDAMNADPRFARARLRRLMPALAAEGIDAATLARAARQFRRADEALTALTQAFLDRALTTNALGMARMPRDRLAAEAEETRFRALGAIIAAVGGSGEAPGEEKLAALVTAAGAGTPFRRTLGGAVIRTQGGDLVFHREPGRLDGTEAALPRGYAGRWDGRFEVAIGGAEGITLAPLAGRGYAELPERFRARPRAAVETVPAFRREGRLVAVPAVGFATPGSEGLRSREVAAARLGGSRQAGGRLHHDRE
ncbi:MAG: tRNA lysidine(34) synthetase TilS [Bauldia sp.]|nr:tRNA lysidine(34) synthetase TilS [Bauldia sp.]